MTGWNLPDGCTNADIDRAMGGGVRCFGCEEEIEDEEVESVWWRGKEYPACSKCAAQSEDR